MLWLSLFVIWIWLLNGIFGDAQFQPLKAKTIAWGTC
jgi:hypothetical protein